MKIASTHYVPVLKAKMGEFQAVQNLQDEVKRALTPIFEVVAVPWDWENDTQAKSIDEHLHPLPQRLLDAWGGDRPLYADLFMVEDEGPLTGGTNPMASFAAACRDVGLQIIPVTGLERQASYQEDVSDVIAADQRGVAVRLTMGDMSEGVFPGPALDSLLASLGCNHDAVDLVLDLGPIADDLLGSYKMTVPTLCQEASSAGHWRSLVLAASSFPRDLSDFDRDSISTKPRTEWLLWLHLRGLGQRLSRLPAFGDYAIAHPTQIDIDPRIMTMSHSIRYTADLNWIVVKGHGHKKGSASQYPSLCNELVQLPQCADSGFSWGDSFIAQCAAGQAGPGNATTWRAVGTNRHLTAVTSQIANLPAV